MKDLDFLKSFYILSQKVRLIWTLCAVVLIMFGLDFSPVMSLSTGDNSSGMNQKLTALPGTIVQVQSSEAVGGVKNTSNQLAQASEAKPQGQVKAISAVSIPASNFSGVYSHTVYGYGCPFYGCPTYSVIDPTSPKVGVDFSGTYHTWVKFPLDALPPGQTVLSARLRSSPLCEAYYPFDELKIGPYRTDTFYYSPTGIRDPVLDSYLNQFHLSVGFDSWNNTPNNPNAPVYRVYVWGKCTDLTNSDLGSDAASDITLAKSLVNRFSLGIAGTFAASRQSWTVPIGSSFWLDLTYGTPEVDLKVNSSDGPITVKGGTYLNLSWDYSGFNDCIMNSSPTWYTTGWEAGKYLPSKTGTRSTKIYYENVTYSVFCKNSSSGATKSDSVTVNVTS